MWRSRIIAAIGRRSPSSGGPHHDYQAPDDPMLDEDEEEDEALSVWDAADIWLSSGMDEDYMFGYSAEELRSAADIN